MTKYSVTIDLDNETLAALNNGFQMQVYKGVKTSSPTGALPTVWFDVNKFASTVTVSWEEQFGGYFSNTQVRNGVVVDISTQQPMNPGDVITLSDTGSASVSTTGGVDGAFAFKSDQTTEWTSGLLSKNSQGKFSPICAFPQYGAVGNIMAPYEKILLLFTQDQLDTGAVVETAVSRSISIIMSTLKPTANVGFSINTGWETNGNPQAKENPQNFALAPDLILPSATMSNIQKEHERSLKSSAKRVLAEV
jgi:hypothetical protein